LRSILAGRELLMKNLGWIVGDGQSINVWDDPWLSLSKQERPMGPPTEASATLSVLDLLLPGTSEWDVDRIRLVLPEYETKIRSITLSIMGTPEKLVWLGTKDGIYTAKSGYYAVSVELENGNPQDADFDWKKNVWNLDCAPKVKHFAWKLLKRAIPVGERLQERHLDVDPKCKRCEHNESILHLLFHCQYAQEVWQLAPFTTEMEYRGIIDLMSSWPSICAQKCLPPSGVTSGVLFPWILWSIWKSRNRFVFEVVFISPKETLSTAIKLAREWCSDSKADPTRPSARINKQMAQGETSVTAVRSDAAWMASSNLAGLGWTILSESGHEYKKRAEFIPSPLVAEGLAMREAIQSYRRSDLQDIRLESDSAQLIQCVNSRTVVTELHSIVSDILAFASDFRSVSFLWIPREKNMAADSLAKMALNALDNVLIVDAINAPN